MKLSVIIVSYNVKYYIEQCLISLYKASTEIDIEIFIVDNASSDNTVEYLFSQFPKEKFPTLKIIENAVNIGFGKANNMAVQQSSGQYVLFINPDTFVAENTLFDCISFIDSHSDAGVVGVRMLKPDGSFAPESRRGLPTPFTSFCKFMGFARIFPRSRYFGRYYMRYLDESCPNEIDVASGAFMMVSREVLKKVGGFDPQFFMYGEDIDLSYRIQKSGYKNWYLPIRILHYKGESTKKTSYRYVYVFYEAMLIFSNKHYHNKGFFTFLIKIAIYLLAIKTFIQLQLAKLSTLSHAWSNIPQHRYLFVGSSEMLVQAREMCDHWMLDGEFVEGKPEQLPHGHLDLKLEENDVYDFVVYDMERFSYSQLLAYFDKSSNKSAQIGTYYPNLKMMITSQNVYKL